MGSLVQVLILLAQLFPAALKAISAWQQYHGQQLNNARRKQLASDVKNLVQTAVDTKNTAGLEDAIKSLGKPPAFPADAPNSKTPS